MRRKHHTESQLTRIDYGYRGYCYHGTHTEDVPLKRRLHSDEVGIMIDGTGNYTYDLVGGTGEIAFTNSAKLRFTTMPLGNALGEMGPMMVIIRELKPKEHREMDQLFSQHPYKDNWEDNEDMDELFDDPEQFRRKNGSAGWSEMILENGPSTHMKLIRVS